MTKITLNLSNLYASAFGRLASANQPKAVSIEKTDQDYQFEFYGIPDEFENVEFEFESQKVKFGAYPFVSGTTKVANLLAPPPIISFSRDKQHIETEINGTDNQVVERWGTKPFNIRLRGLLIDIENRVYPEDQVRTLNQLFEYNGVVDVTGTQFFDKNIASIYFKSIQFNGVQGFQDTIQYTLEARSIKPVGFTLKRPNTVTVNTITPSGIIQ